MSFWHKNSIESTRKTVIMDVKITAFGKVTMSFQLFKDFALNTTKYLHLKYKLNKI